MRPALLLILVLAGCAGQPAAAPTPPAQAVAAPAVRVIAHTVQLAPLDEQARWTGLVQSERKARVVAQLPGEVTARAVDRGDAVIAGQLLVRLDDSKLRLELDRARAAEGAARHTAEYAARERDRALELGDALSAAARDQAEHGAAVAADGLAQAAAVVRTVERTLRDITIEAPFAGVVVERYVDVGDVVAPGVPVAALVSVDPVRVQVGLSSAETARFEPGREARVFVEDLGGREFAGTLLHVARVPDPFTGTWLADFRVANADGALREGMVAQVEPQPSTDDVLAVPQSALVDSVDGPAVFVIEGQGSAALVRRRALRLGRRGGSDVEVLSGLEPGDRVVIEGQFALSDGVAVSPEGD